MQSSAGSGFIRYMTDPSDLSSPRTAMECKFLQGLPQGYPTGTQMVSPIPE